MIPDLLKNIVFQKKIRLRRLVPQAGRVTVPTCSHYVVIITSAYGACSSNWPFLPIIFHHNQYFFPFAPPTTEGRRRRFLRSKLVIFGEAGGLRPFLGPPGLRAARRRRKILGVFLNRFGIIPKWILSSKHIKKYTKNSKK